jgi:hypothetical protein
MHQIDYNSLRLVEKIIMTPQETAPELESYIFKDRNGHYLQLRIDPSDKDHSGVLDGLVDQNPIDDGDRRAMAAVKQYADVSKTKPCLEFLDVLDGRRPQRLVTTLDLREPARGSEMQPDYDSRGHLRSISIDNMSDYDVIVTASDRDGKDVSYTISPYDRLTIDDRSDAKAFADSYIGHGPEVELADERDMER